MNAPQEIAKVVAHLMADDTVRTATFYGSPTFTVKATRTRKPDKQLKYGSYVVSVGPPNYAEREYIKLCKKAGYAFPLKKVRLKHYPRSVSAAKCR